MRLEFSYNVQKFGESPHIDLWEIVVLELAEMAVVADNIGGPSRDGTVDKLVVVGVSRDEVEAINGSDTLDIRCIGNGLDDKRRELTVVGHAHQYLFVFKQYLRAYTQSVASLPEGLPDVVAERARHKDWNEAVSVEDNLHLRGLFVCGAEMSVGHRGKGFLRPAFLLESTSTAMSL